MRPELPIIILAIFGLFIILDVMYEKYYSHQERMACIQQNSKSDFCRTYVIQSADVPPATVQPPTPIINNNTSSPTSKYKPLSSQTYRPNNLSTEPGVQPTPRPRP